MLTQYVPVLIFLAVALGMALVLLLATRLGPQRRSREKALPYECGQNPAGTPRSRISVQFYRIAILFLVFDIEAVCFYPWAVRYRELSCEGVLREGVCQGTPTAFGLLVMLVFVAVLVLALCYVWGKRALEWD